MKLAALIVLATALLLTGCAPEVGSKKWCEQLENKPKGDWSANEAKDFAKHCIFRSDE
ncbi:MULTISPECIES: DUF3012 domain-containing protein [unclassified Arsukibacterium]|uniref:DUF3012 domain-containing protein n=1 Tax=unclassified Arsukibacterium TaxID=2635278 RepID=UPI000C48E50F|nr:MULTISPECIES: DUF3012 domain-containing protein [unclassified Arsukibacterium]MAA95230.1 hypothetical protein [Rheinheimera sp.]MBM35005.1 hypothetical protein [Rheinheimera sp.]HAW92435.1 DUF3012 domain-containing protein [Candidatus Azambacteria bacterium]|tara:strand:- start:267 stop:440 length:174 start_codon:yes stop_codon:yes gene_type:complete